MFETDRLQQHLVDHVKEFDEIWVPSEFNRQTFAASGIDKSKIFLLPEVRVGGAVTLHRQEQDIPAARGEEGPLVVGCDQGGEIGSQGDSKTASNSRLWALAVCNETTSVPLLASLGDSVALMVQSINLTAYDPAAHKPVTIRMLPGTEQAVGSTAAGGNTSFVFLSIFKWEGRKGWDVLLKAFLEEFKVKMWTFNVDPLLDACPTLSTAPPQPSSLAPPPLPGWISG